MPLTAVAEMNCPHGGDMGQRAEHLTKELGLNPEQKTKVEAIFEAQKEKSKALHEETHASLKAIFTPEQLTKFEAMQAKHQEMRKERRAGKAEK
jgi:Spy/CpxP family protein refolding chaperone